MLSSLLYFLQTLALRFAGQGQQSQPACVCVGGGGGGDKRGQVDAVPHTQGLVGAVFITSSMAKLTRVNSLMQEL